MGKIEKVVFIDTETTGLIPGVDRIVEIAAVHVDVQSWEVIDAYESLIHVSPEHLGKAWAPERFAGLDFANAPAIENVLRDLGIFLDGATLAGQNPHFDLGFLREAYESCNGGLGMPFPPLDYHTIDTGSMVIPLVFAGVLDTMSLKSGRIWAGGTGAQAHRAMADVLDSIQVCRKACETMWAGLAVRARETLPTV